MEERIGDFDHFAEAYASKTEWNAYNALYERPAFLNLLSTIDLQGKQILDAGCGAGYVSVYLVEKGAYVTAIDQSVKMLEITRKKLTGESRLINADLNAPLDFIGDESFDLIVSSLTLHFIENWSNVFGEFHRILKQKGRFIFSTHHPFMDVSHALKMNYPERQLVTEEWKAFLKEPVTMSYFRRSLGEMFQELKIAGFTIIDLIEPLPLESCKTEFPEDYKKLSEQPVFILFVCTKE